MSARTILLLGALLMITRVTFASEPVDHEGAAPAAHEETSGASQAASHGSSHETSHGAGHEVPGWSELAVPLLLRSVNFGIFALLLFLFLRKPIHNFLVSRRKTVTEAIETSQERKDWAEHKFQEYQSRLDHIGDEITALKASLEKEGAFEREKILAQAKHHADAIRRDAALISQADWEERKEELRREAIERAAEVARETILRTFQEQDQERFGREFIDALRQDSKSNPKGQA